MTDRYFAKVVNVTDQYTIVINAGMDKQLAVGTHFLVVGIGETVIDPDTNESLGELEIIRGRAKVVHVQDRIATLTAADYTKQPDVKKVTRVKTTSNSTLGNFFGPQEQTTETLTPSEPVLKPLDNVQVGDRVIAIHPGVLDKLRG